ncbi:MAG: HAD-IA family hydrolase [Acutalibacteraceae bacterium]
MDQFGLAGETLDRAIELYNHYFLTEGIKDAALYPGMGDLLRELKQAGCQLTVATARSDRSLYPLFEANGLSDTFDHIACTYDSKTKVNKTALVRLIDFMGCRPKVVMIGDRIFDIDGGKQTTPTSCHFGLPMYRRFIRATYIAHSTEELKQILMGGHQ